MKRIEVLRMMAQVFLIMLTFMGTQHLVLSSEFRISNPIFDANCVLIHFHARNFSDVTALDGTVIPDPSPSFCGYGLVGLVPFGIVPPSALSDADGDGIADAFDSSVNDPDANDNGIIDGLEDPDSDGIDTATELNLAFTDPGLPDSDGNGQKDGVQYRIGMNAGDFTHLFTINGAFLFANISAQAMAGNVDAANQLLKGAGIRLVSNRFDVDVSAGTDVDGALDATDRDSSRRYFGWDLDAAGRRGVYAGYAFDLGADIGSPEVVVHGTTPFAFMVPTADANLAAAHLASAVGLATGFEPDATGANDDLSTPFDLGLGTFIAANGLAGVGYSDESIAGAIQLGIKYHIGRTTRVIGNTVTQRKDQWGKMSDIQGDATSPDMDIDAVSIQGEEGFALKSIRFELLRDFPATVFTTYLSVAWDLDDNPLTGFTVGGVAGIDLENTVEIHRDVNGGPLTLGHIQIDSSTGIRSVGRPAFYTKLEYRSPFSVQPTTASPGALIEFDADFSNVSVPLSVNLIPTYAFSQTFSDLQTEFGAADQLNLVFGYRDFEARPSLVYGGTYGGAASLAAAGTAAAAGFPLPNDVVNLDLTGLTPLTPFDLLVDSTNVLSSSTDASGNFMGTFNVPSGLAPGNYFLTALDQTGEYAGSILIVPEPGSRELGLSALAVLCLLARRRSTWSRRGPARTPSRFVSQMRASELH